MFRKARRIPSVHSHSTRQNGSAFNLEMLEDRRLFAVGPALGTVSLINAATDAVIKSFTAGTTIDLSAGKQYSIRANITGATKSVVFSLDGAKIRTESSAPFSIAGDNPITGGGTDYLPLTGLTNGTHTLVVSGFDATGGTGN